MWHFQGDVPDWPRVVSRTICKKAIDRGDILKTAKLINPKVFTILRHHVGNQEFGGTWEDNVQRALDFFSRFIDGTFDEKYAPYVDAIEEYNEYLANSHTPEEVQMRLMWALACAHVWEHEYRTQPLYQHIRLILCNTAVGNIIDWRFGEIAMQYDCLLGYHPYTLWEHKQRWDGDFDNLSGLFNTMEEALWPDHIKPTWVLTEAGPFRNAADGWRHPEVLDRDINAYINAVRLWIEDVKGTRAYQEGRIIGFNLFNTGGTPEWVWYETNTDEMEALAPMIEDLWVPVSQPPPEPPSDPANVKVINCTRLNMRTDADPSTQLTRITSVPVNSVWRWTGDKKIGTDGDEWLKILLGWHPDYADGGVIYAWGHSHFLEKIADMRVVDIVDDLPKHPVKRYTTRGLDSISTHVVHHSATSPDVTPWQIARYHVESLGWPGIGYHFVIASNGTIYQTNRLTTVSYHVGSCNGYTVGTCLVGNFTVHEPTNKQIQSLSWLQNYWIPESLGRKLPLKGHKEMPGQQTLCPGNKWNWSDI